MQPVTRYAKSGEVDIAYQVLGEGPLNLVSSLRRSYRTSRTTGMHPEFCLLAASSGKLRARGDAGQARDRMSDRVAELPGLDQRMDDLRAVMDTVGMDQAVLLGVFVWDRQE